MSGPANEPASWRYRAFISYSHQDRAWADWLHRALETYRVPGRLVGRTTRMGIVPGRIAPVFRDREELATATSLGTVIHSALEASATLVVICSPAAARSRWVNEEILAYKRLGRADRILCLIAAGEPNASDTPESGLEECFPEALRYALAADGTLTDQREEPVAADARPGGDGKTGAKLKLLAGILGVGLDELRQREQQRRQKRLVAVSAASLAGMVLAGFLALSASIARQDAERNRESAEELIGFMLGDLTQNLRAVGRLDVFDAIGDKALDYFESLPEQDLTSRTLAQRADALTLIGEIAFDRADLAGAVRAFNQSVQQARMLASREPESGSWQRQLADSELWLGFAYWQQGNLDDALDRFRLALAAADRAQELSPGDVDALVLRATAHNNIAQVLERRGALSAARQEYETVLELHQQVQREDPGNPDWQAEIGFAHNTLGKIDLRLGRLDSAQRHYARDLELKLALVAADPAHRLWQRYLAMSESHMGALAELTGNHAAAKAHIDRAIALGTQLVTEEPEHATRRRFLARQQTRRGRLAHIDGDLETALVLQHESRLTLQELVAKDAAGLDNRASLADASLALADTLAAAGRQEEAVAEARAALGLLAEIAAAGPSNIDAQVGLAVGELTAARILRADGGAEHGAELFAAALNRLDAVAGDSSEPAVLHARTAALAGLGNVDAARSVAERLLGTGYRQADFMTLARSLGALPGGT